MSSNIIQTERLTLRPYRPSDVEHLRHFRDNPDELKYMMFYITTDSGISEFLVHAISQVEAQPRTAWHFAVERRDTGAYIGGADLMMDAHAPTSAEIGYWFRSDSWGKGYASEAAQAIISYGFNDLGLHRIWGKCHTENTGSAAVMEKCGMQFEGIAREHAWLRDHYRSSRMYALLATDPRD